MPVVGTSIHSGGLTPYPLLSSTSKLDIVDTHTYWQHPSYTADASGRRTGYTIRNTPAVNEPARLPFLTLTRSAVKGKPFMVSEVNHPYPNEYAAEAHSAARRLRRLSGLGCRLLVQLRSRRGRNVGYTEAARPLRYAAGPSQDDAMGGSRPHLPKRRRATGRAHHRACVLIGSGPRLASDAGKGTASVYAGSSRCAASAALRLGSRRSPHRNRTSRRRSKPDRRTPRTQNRSYGGLCPKVAAL